MIGLLPVKVSMTTKEQITLSRSGERAKTSGHFYGRLRAVQGIRGLSYTGGSGANGLRTTTTTLSTTTGSEIPCTAQARLTNFVVVVSSTTPNTVDSRRPAIHNLPQV